MGGSMDSGGLTGTASCPGTWLVKGGSDGPMTGGCGGCTCIGGGAGCICCASARVIRGASGPIDSREATSAAAIQGDFVMVIPPCTCHRPRAGIVSLALLPCCPHADTSTLAGRGATITRKNQGLQPVFRLGKRCYDSARGHPAAHRTPRRPYEDRSVFSERPFPAPGLLPGPGSRGGSRSQLRLVAAGKGRGPGCSHRRRALPA